MNIYERLDSLQIFGIKLGLKNISSLLTGLGDPQRCYRSVLIAGTNGKGSVGAMLDAILRAQGIRTGYYTSPHLVDVKERIKVAGKTISAAAFEDALESVFQQSERLENPATYFETLTAVACQHFKAAGVQLGIFEVGLGGRFDATNAIEQDLSIVTNIDLDHEELLGNSIGSIAREKAGIFKPAVPAVTGSLVAEAREAIDLVAAESGCPVIAFDPSSLQDLRLENAFPVFYYRPWNCPVRVNLRGSHQAENAGLALLAAEEFGFAGDREAALHALDTVYWPGRLDLISADPVTVFDCAHNPGGVRSLLRFVDDMDWQSVIALFTAMKDKKVQGMLRLLAPKTKQIVLTRVAPYDRCATGRELKSAAQSAGLSYELIEKTDEAFARASQLAEETNLPLITFGSIYLIGELFRLMGDKKPQRH